MREGKSDGVIRAAGAIVWRPGHNGPDIALVHRPRYGDWSFPKGKCVQGEHPLATVIREVAEETGLRVVLGRPLSSSRYETGGRSKRVRYWAARLSGSVGGVPGHEVDEVRWFPAEEACRRLSYERDIVLLEEFLAEPLRTTPLILLRHAVAGHKPKTGPDRLSRPLDAHGAADAMALAGLLASYGRCRVLSSAAERCAATIRPYAAAVGVPVEIEQALTVMPGHPPSDHLPGVALVTKIAAAEVAAAICGHRENLSILVDAAFVALGADPPGERPLRKGAFWVLHAAAGRLIAAERHEVRE